MGGESRRRNGSAMDGLNGAGELYRDSLRPGRAALRELAERAAGAAIDLGPKGKTLPDEMLPTLCLDGSRPAGKAAEGGRGWIASMQHTFAGFARQ